MTCSVYVNVPVPGYPVASSQVFPGLPKALRSAFVYKGMVVFHTVDGSYFSGVIGDTADHSEVKTGVVSLVRRVSNPLASVDGTSGLPLVLDAAFTSVPSKYTVVMSGRRQYIIAHETVNN